MTEKTREQWLHECAELLWPKVVACGGSKPARYRVSCGWPSRNPLLRPSKHSRRIGECWSAGSEDKAREIFISPALDNPVEVADVLLHELIHAALPPEIGHKHPFPGIAKRLGLQGKPTATFAGEELAEELGKLTDTLGKYPHAKLDAAVRPKQAARQMKCQCPDCGYVIRVARSWIDVGLPTCVCGTKMDSIDYTDGDGMAREPLTLRESFSSYVTEDGLFELSTTKRAGKEGMWNVLETETGRMTIRRNRADALEWLAAYRADEVDFPELDADDSDIPEDDYLDDDELEVSDYVDLDGEWDPEVDEYPEPEPALSE
jgi:hypothetical protein